MSAQNGTSLAAGNGLLQASSSKAPLDASQALATLASYPHGDGLAMSELIDSRTHGGLTYNEWVLSQV